MSKAKGSDVEWTTVQVSKVSKWPVTGFPRGRPEADFGPQDHRAENQLLSAASYSQLAAEAV